MLCGRTRPTPVRLTRMRSRHYYQNCVSVRASPIHESTLTICRLILILPDIVVEDFSQHVRILLGKSLDCATAGLFADRMCACSHGSEIWLKDVHAAPTASS